MVNDDDGDGGWDVLKSMCTCLLYHLVMPMVSRDKIVWKLQPTANKNGKR